MISIFVKLPITITLKGYLDFFCKFEIYIFKFFKMSGYSFEMEMSVRDYGHTIYRESSNNSVYQKLPRHVRHEYLKSIGIDWKDYSLRGINLVVVRVELDYKFSLTSGDKFIVGLNVEKESELKIEVNQDIYRKADNKLILKGR